MPPTKSTGKPPKRLPAPKKPAGSKRKPRATTPSEPPPIWLWILLTGLGSIGLFVGSIFLLQQAARYSHDSSSLSALQSSLSSTPLATLHSTPHPAPAQASPAPLTRQQQILQSHPIASSDMTPPPPRFNPVLVPTSPPLALTPLPAIPQAQPILAPTPAVAILSPVPTTTPTPFPTPIDIPVAPVDPSTTPHLTRQQIAAYQIMLERRHFSCGFIDGSSGMRTQRMLRAYQTSVGLPASGILDGPTIQSIGAPVDPFTHYTVTPADLANITPHITTWREKAEAHFLGYSNAWELFGEKFHCTRAYLKDLNPNVTDFEPGLILNCPNLQHAAPVPSAASLRISLSDTSIEALDGSGRIVGFFPCSIAKDKNKRPNGSLTVVSVVPDPDYTFDPELFKDSAAEEHLTHKLLIPPGPRNPVGTAWIGLSLPGYGIHGTPEPENISRTQSHGCFRLANWNARTVLKMVNIGTPIDVEP